MADEHNKPHEKTVPLAPPVPPPHLRAAAAPVAPVPAAENPEPEYKYPYTGPSEIVEGGAYIQGAKTVRGKLMGGRIVNAHGEVLATFKDDQENTGKPDDGQKPKDEKK